MNNTFLLITKDIDHLPTSLITTLNKIRDYHYTITPLCNALNEMHIKNYDFFFYYIEKSIELNDIQKIVEEFPCFPFSIVLGDALHRSEFENTIFDKAIFLIINKLLINSIYNFINLHRAEDVKPFLHYKKGSVSIDKKFIFKSQKMKELYLKIESLKDSDAPILITGESGTGKQIVSLILHNHSRFAKSPFVELNCATVPNQLLESEFFGYEKGSFSGAFSSYEGKLEAVKNGTLFLDEIGEMDLKVQSKLLNVLEKRPYYSIGSNKPKIFNGRIIVATNKNLNQAIADNEFRKDLFYRLNVIHLHIPPLRERREDIRLFAEYFFNLHLTKYNKPFIIVSESVYTYLEQCHFEGNIRELSNIIERLVLISNPYALITDHNVKEIFSEEVLIQKEFVNSKTIDSSPCKYILNEVKDVVPLKTVLRLQEKIYLETLTKQYSNMSQLAKMLNIERSSLYRKLKQHDLIK